MSEPFRMGVTLGEIVLVGLVLLVVNLWPAWRHLKRLAREGDEKASKILEKWQPSDRVEPS